MQKRLFLCVVSPVMDRLGETVTGFRRLRDGGCSLAVAEVITSLVTNPMDMVKYSKYGSLKPMRDVQGYVLMGPD